MLGNQQVIRSRRTDAERGRRAPPKVVGNQFQVDQKLGAGCFGEVWLARDINAPGKQVAVKFEDLHSRCLQLDHEAEILKALAHPMQQQGFLTCQHFGREGLYQCLVMGLLGMSLEDHMKSNRRFDPKTTTLVAQQVLHRIEYLHSKGFVHRDIKPENFMLGIGDRAHHIHLIDFGLTKRYFENKHIAMRTRLKLTGTARYASINSHHGYEQSRRDDLEAIGHMLLYFLRGALPWSGLDARSQEEKYRKIKEKKIATPLDELCAGFPNEFKKFLEYSRQLAFKARPDYNMLYREFANLRAREGFLCDHAFQWMDDASLQVCMPLVQLIPRPSTTVQPDERSAVKRVGCFYCWGNMPM